MLEHENAPLQRLPGLNVAPNGLVAALENDQFTSKLREGAVALHGFESKRGAKPLSKVALSNWM